MQHQVICISGSRTTPPSVVCLRDLSTTEHGSCKNIYFRAEPFILLLIRSTGSARKSSLPKTVQTREDVLIWILSLQDRCFVTYSMAISGRNASPKCCPPVVTPMTSHSRGTFIAYG